MLINFIYHNPLVVCIKRILVRGGFAVKGVFFNLVHLIFHVARKAKLVPRNIYYHTFLCLLEICAGQFYKPRIIKIKFLYVVKLK